MIRETRNKIGRLYPLLVDAQDNIIDGYNRLQADPGWREDTRKLDWVTDKKTQIIARTVANQCRREVPESERRKDFGDLAEILITEGKERGEIAKTISELIGFSVDYIRDRLPDRFKATEKAKAGRRSARAKKAAVLGTAEDKTEPKLATVGEDKPESVKEAEKTFKEGAILKGEASIEEFYCPCGKHYNINWESKILWEETGD